MGEESPRENPEARRGRNGPGEEGLRRGGAKWRELDLRLKALPTLVGQGCQKGDSGGLVQGQ